MHGRFQRLSPWLVLTSVVAAGCGESHAPDPVLPLGLTSLSVAAGHTCGLTAAGVAWCWGVGADGKLGGGPDRPGDQIIPALVSGGLTFKSISAGNVSTCALAGDGQAFCWGQDHGALGTGAMPPSDSAVTPVPIGGALRFSSIATGSRHVCAIEVSGDAYCWGDEVSAVPSLVADGRKYTSVVVSGSNSCGLGVDGKAYCWTVLVPLAAGPATDLTFESIGMGAGQICGLTSAHEIHCWDTQPEFTEPVSTRLMPGSSWASLRLSVNAGCAVTVAGDGYCWGNNDFGKLGNGLAANIPYPDPTPVKGGLHFAVVAPGENHSCGLTTDHVAYCWGVGVAGLLGIGTVPSFPEPYVAYEPVRVSDP